jgi:hypothetical protein
MSDILSYLTQADIRDAAPEIQGKILTRPALVVTDGDGVTYACDVDIGKTDPLRNVPIAANNNALTYAEAGCAVTLRKTVSGQYTITGFAKEMPGTYIRIPVTIATGAFGPTENLSITSRPLTLGELQDYGGGFGIIPFGAVATFQGGVLIRISS